MPADALSKNPASRILRSEANAVLTVSHAGNSEGDGVPPETLCSKSTEHVAFWRTCSNFPEKYSSTKNTLGKTTVMSVKAIFRKIHGMVSGLQ